jgi:hypothetical protein
MVASVQELILAAQARQPTGIKQLGEIIESSFNNYQSARTNALDARNQRLDIARKLVENQMREEQMAVYRQSQIERAKRLEEIKRQKAESDATRDAAKSVSGSVAVTPLQKFNSKVTFGDNGGFSETFEEVEPAPMKMEVQPYYDEKTKTKRLGKRDAAANIFRSDEDPMADAPETMKPVAPANPSDMRKEFTSLSTEFLKVNEAINRVRASGKDPSAAGDLALIFNYMKTLDPGSTVREGEFATAQNSASVPGRLRAQYNAVISGERLAPEQRNDFLTRAEMLFEGQKKVHEKRVSEYRRLATSSGVDPAQVIVDFSVPVEGKTISPEDQAAIEWAKANPNDPRSAEIRRIHGL